MFKKFIIVLAVLVYSIIIFIVCKVLISSISPLYIFEHYTSAGKILPVSTEITLLPPFVSTDDIIYCTAKLSIGDSFKYSICKINPSEGKTEMLFNFDSVWVVLTAFCRTGNKELFFYTRNNEPYTFILTENKNIYNISSPEFTDETILAIGLAGGNPECITVKDSVGYVFKRYFASKPKNYKWEYKQLITYPLYMRLCIPLSAYHYDGWHFLFTSNYYRKDNLYVKNPKGTTNVMLFQHNISFHSEDIIINKPFFSSDMIDNTFSGLLSSDFINCDKYTFCPLNKKFFKINCPDETYSAMPVFCLSDAYPERFPLFIDNSENKRTYLVYLNNDKHIITYNTDNSTDITSFFLTSNNTETEFAKFYDKFDYLYFIPYNNHFIFITDNAQYCIFNNKLERIDIAGFSHKLDTFITKHFHQLINNYQKIESYTIPVLLTGFPIVLFFSFFIFFIIKVFITKKRPSYSVRKTKGPPYSKCLLFASLIYLLSSVIFIKNFISLLQKHLI